MVKGYHLRWHTIVGVALLFLLLITIFLPGMSINAEKYIDSAVTANQYAFDRDHQLTEAQEIVEGYKAGGDRRLELKKDYEKQISRNGDSSITRLFLAKWCLTVDKALEFDGIETKSDRTLRNSGVKSVLCLWGWLIYIPFLTAMVLIVFMLMKGCTLSGALLAEGVVTLLCECLSHFLIPSMLWSSGKSAVLYFELVSEDVLEQYGAGEKFLEELFSRCGGVSWIIVSLLAVLIIVYSIVCLILWGRSLVMGNGNRYSKDVSGENPVSGGITTRQNKKLTGELRGIKGEYMGQSIAIQAGEEIVLGRDPKYCMLIFGSPKVSRRQCGIRYDAENACYQVIDYSSGGTTLADKTLLATSEYTMLHSGAVIHIGGGTEVFMMM